jgi:hypothetical protein
MTSLLCSDGITLSRSFPLLDGIPSSNSRYSYSNATHGSQTPNVIARDAGLRCHILQNTHCASIRGENASHMSRFPSSRIRKSPLFQLVMRSTFNSNLIQGKPSRDPKHQLHVIVTLTLLQMIGLFHQNPQQRASSNIYHGMLVLVNVIVRYFATKCSS